MQTEISEELLSRIIAVAYGDAGLFEKIKIYLLASKHAEVKSILYEYKRTSKVLDKIEIDKCPGEIIERVKNNNGVVKNSLIVSFLNFINQFLHKPVYISAIILIIISSMISLFILNQKNETQISNKRVALAEKQVKQSIVFVSRIFEKTAGRVENDIIKQQVAKPLNEGITTVNNLFKGG